MNRPVRVIMLQNYEMRFFDSERHSIEGKSAIEVRRKFTELAIVDEVDSDNIIKFAKRIEIRLCDASQPKVLRSYFKDFSTGLGRQKSAVLSLTLPNRFKWTAYRALIEEALACNLVVMDDQLKNFFRPVLNLADGIFPPGK